MMLILFSFVPYSAANIRKERKHKNISTNKWIELDLEKYVYTENNHDLFIVWQTFYINIFVVDLAPGNQSSIMV